MSRLNVEHGFIEYRVAPGRTCEIVDIAVEAERRGRGHGRKLVEAVFAAVAGRVDLVYAITRADNRIAQEFYEHLLFRVIGVLREFYSECGAVDAVVYGRSPRGPI